MRRTRGEEAEAREQISALQRIADALEELARMSKLERIDRLRAEGVAEAREEDQ